MPKKITDLPLVTTAGVICEYLDEEDKSELTVVSKTIVPLLV